MFGFYKRPSKKHVVILIVLVCFLSYWLMDLKKQSKTINNDQYSKIELRTALAAIQKKNTATANNNSKPSKKQLQEDSYLNQTANLQIMNTQKTTGVEPSISFQNRKNDKEQEAALSFGINKEQPTPVVLSVNSMSSQNQRKNIKAEEKSIQTFQLNQKTSKEVDILSQSESSSQQLPIILKWKFHRNQTSYKSKTFKCLSGKCISTNNQSEYWNPNTKMIEFDGPMSKIDKMPLPRLPNHLWALNHENSPYTAWILSFDKMISLFNYTATFRRESDFPSTLRYLPTKEQWVDKTFFVPTKEKNRLQKEEGLAPIVYIQSNCQYAPSDRDYYVKELMKYIKIDAYGKCLNNRDMPENLKGRDKHSHPDMLKLVSKYKFQLAFENSVCPDYMTEKIFRPLISGIVPIYHGSSKITDFMPTNKSIIKVMDFENPKELAKFIGDLNQNDLEYNLYLQHKLKNITFNPTLINTVSYINNKIKLPKNFQRFQLDSFTCFLCDQLHERDRLLKTKQNSLNLYKPDISLPIKIANSSHMGCPIPKPWKPDHRLVNIFPDIWRREADAYLKMLQVNETDITKFEEYKKMVA